MKRTLLNNVLSCVPSPVPATPEAGAGEITTGGIIDRQGFLSAVLGIAIGGVTGDPTKAALTLKIHTGDNADGSDLAPLDDEKAVRLPKEASALTENMTYSIPVDLLGCKRYIRLVPSLTFTGGTSPALDISGTSLTLGDADQQPVG